MIDVLLIQPPIRDFYLTSKRTLPYGLACIAASLQAVKISVDILDGLATSKSRHIEFPDEMSYLHEFYDNNDVSPFALFHLFKHFGYSFEHLGKQARDSGAYLIGISSLFTAYSAEAIQTAQSVKTWQPNCIIVMGGHHPTAMPEQVMTCSAVDYLIRGEGEVSFPLLATILKKDKTPSDHLLSTVPGLVFRKTDGTLHIAKPVWMNDLDRFPIPATHLIRTDYYRRGGKASAVIVGSRGCPMSCSYCSLGKNSLTPYRRRSVESVLDEIDEAVVRDHAGFIDFEDENLSLDRNWLMTLLSRIESRFSNPRPELRAMNGLLPSSLDKEMVFAMKSAGFKTLNLSLGTTSTEQLKRFNRPDLRSSLEGILGIAETCGLNAVSYIIIAAPFQNPVDSVDDLLYLAQLRTLVGVSVYYPSPGSLDFRSFQSLGIFPEHLPLMRSTALPLSHTTTRLETITLMRLGRILNFMKSLKDQGMDIRNRLPDIHPGEGFEMRQNIGIQLIQMFLSDGKIRGVTPDGTIYAHNTASHLVERFRSGIQIFQLKGVRGTDAL